MSKDHYVAQTYLKQFGDSSAGGMLHAYRKPDGISFDCWPKDVCHEWDGDRNPFLAYPELLGTLRSIFEPQWNMSVANILTGSTQDKLVVASYMANMMVCVPAWQRVGSEAVSRQTTGALSFEKQMREKFGPSDAEISAVTAWLSGEGLSVTKVDDSVAGYVAVSGSVQAVAQAFGVTFAMFLGPDKKADRAPEQDATAPASVAGYVLTVTGLDTASHYMRPFDTLPPRRV